MSSNTSPSLNANASTTTNTRAALCYSLGFVSGIFFLLTEGDSDYIRFHALQSVLVFTTLSLLNTFLISNAFLKTAELLSLPLTHKYPSNWMIYSLVALSLILFSLATWALLILKAYKGKRYKLPVIGDIAQKS